VVALGVFDGMHLAHRRILREAIIHAHRIKGTSVVVTFSPHPRNKESLYSLEHRIRLMAQLGVDVCIIIRFSKAFSKIPAENFIRDIVVGKIHARYIYVGKNFRFGKGAEADIRTLKRLSSIYGFGLKIFDLVKLNNKPISSTYIRKLITQGKLSLAEKLLLRPVSVLGTVIKGAYLGTRLGFPTANIDPHHEVLPSRGVYAVRVNFAKSKLGGICYIGSRPTLKKPKITNSQKDRHVEVHIFNFKKNIYGKYLEIEFIKKLRNEKNFRLLRDLVRQVRKDILRAKKILSLHPCPPQDMPI
jgi:riboflavin kinase/FMN adenylyltransferase